MKRHVQTAGIRRWSGDDLIELQSEPFKVLDKFFAQFGPMIVSGCTISGTTIAEGLVLLPDGDGGARVAPFKGASGISVFPVYLTLKKDTISREYENATVQPIVYSYEAVLTQIKPASDAFITISNTAKNNTFVEAIQDSLHRLVTDKQITEWSKPRDFIISANVTNLNAFQLDGLRYFACESNTIGAPDFYEYHGISIIESDQGAQLAFGVVNNAIFMRTLIDGDWSNWIKIWNEKTLKPAKENIVDAVKPWLPCRATEGASFMLNANSVLYKDAKESVPVEIYKFRVNRTNNLKTLIGDSQAALIDANGNEISMTERLNETIESKNKTYMALSGDTFRTGFIPVQEPVVVVLTKGEEIDLCRYSIETYDLSYNKISTIPLLNAFRSIRSARYIKIVLTAQMKSIRVCISGNGYFSALHVFNYSTRLPARSDLIYKFEEGNWNTYKINNNVVNVRFQAFEMRRDGTPTFKKNITKQVPRLEFRGVDGGGNIKIKPVNLHGYIVKLFIRKRVSLRRKNKETGKIEKISRNIRYVEKRKKLKIEIGSVRKDVLSRKGVLDIQALPYTLSDIYYSAFKDTFRFSTTGLTTVSSKIKSPGLETYADVAMCLCTKVQGKLVEGEKSYFAVTRKKIREKR